MPAARGRGGLPRGFPLSDRALTSTGTPVVQTLYVDFADAPGDPREIPGTEETLDAVTASLREASGGGLALQRRSHAVWTRLAGASADWEDGARLMAGAVAATDDAVDFSAVDVVWVVWTTQNPHDGFRSQANLDFHVTADGRVLTRGVMLRPFDLSRFGSWTPTHEMGHILGLPDLYDTSASGAAATRWTGPWDLMGSTQGPGRAFFAWHRWMLGWATDTQVDCVLPGSIETVSLSPVQSDGPTLLAAVRLGPMRLLTVESRRAEKWDASIPREGVLVSIVDASRLSGQGPIQVQFPDDRHPGIRDETTLVEAPLKAGETFTDSASGVVVRVESTGGDTDVAQVDASALPVPPVTEKKTIAAYRTTSDGGALISPANLVTRDTGTDVVVFGDFDVNADGGFLRNGQPFFAQTDLDVRAELARVRAAGAQVVVTVGGQDATLWTLLSTDFDRYYANLRWYLLKNDFDSVELDIRSAVGADVIIRLVDALRHDFGPRATLSFVGDPAAFAGGGTASPDYRSVAAARGDDIAWFSMRLPCDAVARGDDYGRLVDDMGVPPQKIVLSAFTRPGLCPEGTVLASPADLARSLQNIVAVEQGFGGIRGDEYAGALPGGAAEPWQWFAMMNAAMNDPAPRPTPAPDPTTTPSPEVTATAAAATASRRELAHSGTGPWLGLLPAAGVAIAAGLLLSGRRRRTVR